MEAPTIICDPGTGYMKMGFAGDNFPKASFASLVGRPMLRYEENLGEDVELKVINHLCRKSWWETKHPNIGLSSNSAIQQKKGS